MSPGRFGRSVLNVLLGLLVAYGLLLVVVYFKQDALLYLPQTLDAEAARLQAAARGLRPLRGDTLHGYLREPPGQAKATVVIFHGNAGHAIDRDFYADALVPLGYRVVLAEYPGYGEKSGSFGEALFAADAVATLAKVRRTYPGPLIAWGESLGAAVVAAAMFARPDLADGVVLLTPWDSLAAVAARHYPWLPVRALLRDRYESAAKLERFAGPAVVVVAGADSIIPPVHGERLHAALAGAKTLKVVADSGHNDWSEAVAPAWWIEVLKAAMPR